MKTSDKFFLTASICSKQQLYSMKTGSGLVLVDQCKCCTDSETINYLFQKRVNHPNNSQTQKANTDKKNKQHFWEPQDRIV